MTTSAPKRTKNPAPLAELEQLEARHAAARATADERARAAHSKTTRARELTDERSGLLHRSPGLADHRGQPLAEIKDNPVAKVDEQLADLGDLADEAAKVDHARRLAEHAKQECDAFTASNFPALVEGLRPEAERVATDIQRTVEAARNAADAYLGMVQRVIGLTAATPNIDGRAVPGLDSVAELRRVLIGWELPPPLPELNR